ncbi:MAG: response regulator transcription factor, partial [Anaerovoracaceae bacterium]
QDYMTKPFEIEELLVRVETVLKRCNKATNVLSVTDIFIDVLARTVNKNGKPVSLTAKKFDLLVLFARNKNFALSRNKIYSAVWGEDYLGDSRTVDLHVQRMRKKLSLEEKIVPVYKVGYRLEE